MGIIDKCEFWKNCEWYNKESWLCNQSAGTTGIHRANSRVYAKMARCWQKKNQQRKDEPKKKNIKKELTKTTLTALTLTAIATAPTIIVAYHTQTKIRIKELATLIIIPFIILFTLITLYKIIGTIETKRKK